ncbi:hypothetical protein Tcan_05661 [Toxocara canis]|uniref:Uncharacterized protein n=1 Tax=Toxocara canis TaxID=6265 RepID=A0A0B2VHN0_TOXCA|nr:hypothetical protein Tcan_05661 [Toxocara canis]
MRPYNNEYRISPDLGYYASCQKAISLYISQLAAGKTPTWNATNANCPLYRLPNTYKGYLACDFVRGRWYAMSYESWIRYELYHNKAYRQFWSNHSSIFLVKPDYLLQRNGTEIDWLASLLTFRIRLLGCGEAEYLVNVDTEWNKPLWMLMHYRLRREDHIHYTSLVANATLDRWTTATFAVIPSTDTQELCVQISWETSEKTLSQCVSFELDGACVQQNAAILHDGLSRNASLLFVILLLFFKSAYCE